jgi:hypothetical protein
VPIPTVRATIVAPEPLLKERSFLRLHNRASKDALRAEGVKHHRERLPGHFQRSAAQKYNHARRTTKYMRMKAKRFRSVTDLVKTGATRDAMVKNPPKIRVGGQAADSDSGDARTLRLTLELRFPFGKAAQAAVAKAIRRGKLQKGHVSSSHRRGVSIEQMRKEIASITTDEAREIAAGFLKRYGQNLAVALAKAPRLRKRVRAAQSK